MKNLKPITQHLTPRGGFTLIEIIIAVAIVAIMSAAALIGFATLTRQARDSRRVSDLTGVQAALELYYNKNTVYPDTQSTWGDLQTLLQGAGVGVSKVPNDPRAPSGATYLYASDGTSYVLGATLEDPNNQAFANGVTGEPISGMSFTCGAPIYCIQL